MAIEERIQRLDHFISLLPVSIEKSNQRLDGQELPANIRHHQDLIIHQAAIMETLDRFRQSVTGDEAIRDRFLQTLLPIVEKTDKDYIRTIGMMESGVKGEGTRWLAGIVDQVVQKLLRKIPSLEMKPWK